MATFLRRMVDISVRGDLTRCKYSSPHLEVMAVKMMFICPECRYFFIFYLVTGEVKTIYIPRTTNTYDILLMTRVNATYLLTMDLTWPKTECIGRM